MRELEIVLNPNKLVKYLRKPASEFNRHDIIRYIEENNIEMVNFRYAGEDGKLKTLNFVITSKDYLESILATGERVDGSSLFSYIEACSSDLYVIPKFRTAYVNPFAEVPTLDLLCSFYTKEGKPLESAPEYILRKANTEFKRATGFTFKAMGELEFYIVSEVDEHYPAVDQKGYHNSRPFSKWEHLRTEAMNLIAQTGGKIKYGHSEVGNFTSDSHFYEQHEIEFQPVEPEEAVEQLLIAKWILRMLGQKYGVNVSFTPKITVGKAGSGLHIHMMVEKDGVNCMVDEKSISDTARKIMVGLLDKAASPHRLWKHDTPLLPAAGATSGGSHQHLLGRHEPVGPGEGTPRLDRQDAHDQGCQSPRKVRCPLYSRQANGRIPGGRWFSRPLPSDGGDPDGGATGAGDARRSRQGETTLCRCQHLQGGEQSYRRKIEASARFVLELCRSAGAGSCLLRKQEYLSERDHRPFYPAFEILRRQSPQ